MDNHGGNPEEVIEDLQTSPDWALMPAVRDERLVSPQVSSLWIRTSHALSITGWPITPSPL